MEGLDAVLRGDVWWADLAEPRRSEPGHRRPILIIQANPFNRSRMQTVVVAAISSNLYLARAPGNVLLTAGAAGLSRDSVVNVSQVLTLDLGFLVEYVGSLTLRLQRLVDEGLRKILQL